MDFYICENGVTQLEVCQRKERSTRPTTPLGLESLEDQLPLFTHGFRHNGLFKYHKGESRGIFDQI